MNNTLKTLIRFYNICTSTANIKLDNDTHYHFNITSYLKSIFVVGKNSIILQWFIEGNKIKTVNDHEISIKVYEKYSTNALESCEDIFLQGVQLLLSSVWYHVYKVLAFSHHCHQYIVVFLM